MHFINNKTLYVVFLIPNITTYSVCKEEDIKLIKSINVLSLFDGIRTGRIALERAGIDVRNYFSSEVKSYAIELADKHFPQDVKNKLGDVTKIDYNKLPKIDLLIGGSPCQDFSQANKKRLGDKGIKSRLFYEYIRALKELKPKYFLLENVRMKPEHEEIITKELGVSPIMIDSALLGAGLRKRLYWTNIPNIEKPKDLGVKLQDVLTQGYTNRDKARCLLESDSRPLTTPVKMFHRYQKFLTLVFKDEKHYLDCKEHYDKNFKGKSAKFIDEQIRRGLNVDIYNGVRHLNKIERELIQTMPSGYCESLTDNQAACVLGDGWTADVIAHIFKGLKGVR